jgi:hypothetical protein
MQSKLKEIGTVSADDAKAILELDS